MRVLRMTLKRRWFDLIASGKKKEEYREIKPYWRSRLFNKDGSVKQYDLVEFKNGYNRNSPTVTLDWRGVRIGQGLTVLGAPKDKNIFIIELGSIAAIRNYE